MNTVDRLTVRRNCRLHVRNLEKTQEGAWTTTFSGVSRGQPYSHAGRVKNTRALSKTSSASARGRQVAVARCPTKMHERQRRSIDEAISNSRQMNIETNKYRFLNNLTENWNDNSFRSNDGP